MIHPPPPSKATQIYAIDWPSSTTFPPAHSGDGFLIEGTCTDLCRVNVRTSDGEYHRYGGMGIRIERAKVRRFNADTGVEIQPEFEASRKVNTGGFLPSSYVSTSAKNVDEITPEAIYEILKDEFSLMRLPCRPAEGVLTFMRNVDCHKDLEVGDQVRLRTDKDSPFIQSVVRTTAGDRSDGGAKIRPDFTAEKSLGDAWTDKIMSTAPPASQDAVEGVDDDEWDD
eukprot:Nk52_evm51s1401 gene=Nk52_evmTU51s1401